MPSKNKMSQESEVVALAIALIVLSYMVIVSIGFPGKKSASALPAKAVTPPAAATRSPLPVAIVTPTYASTGTVVSGFPPDMIIDAKAKIANSYELSYSASLNQYTAIFNSVKDMESLFTDYLAYFAKKGWTITNQVTKYPTSRGIYATSGNNEASVAIMSQSSGLQVVVSYLVK